MQPVAGPVPAAGLSVRHSPPRRLHLCSQAQFSTAANAPTAWRKTRAAMNASNTITRD